MHDPIGFGATILAILLSVIVASVFNNSRIDRLESRLEGRMDKMQSDLTSRLDRMQEALSKFYRELGQHDIRISNLEKQ